jgi:hypothetical protein
MKPDAFSNILPSLSLDVVGATWSIRCNPASSTGRSEIIMGLSPCLSYFAYEALKTHHIRNVGIYNEDYRKTFKAKWTSFVRNP